MASLCKNMEKEVCQWGRSLMKYTPESSTPLCDMSRIAFVSIASLPCFYPLLSKYKSTYFDKLSVKDKKTSQRYDGRVRKAYKNKLCLTGEIHSCSKISRHLAPHYLEFHFRNSVKPVQAIWENKVWKPSFCVTTLTKKLLQ